MSHNSFKENKDGSFESGGYKFDKGGNILSSPKKSGGSSGGSNTIGSGQGAYVNIDDVNDPNAQVYTQDPDGFNKVTEPVVYRQHRRGGGSSSSSTNSIADQTNKIAGIARAENTISSIESGNQFGRLTNTGTSNFITASALATANTKTQSVWTPTTTEIGQAGYKGGVSRSNTMTAQKKVLSDQLTEIATRDATSFAEQEGQRAKRDYDNALEQANKDLDIKFGEIQREISNGGDYDKLVKKWETAQLRANKELTNKATTLDNRTRDRLNNYITDWKNTKGKNLERRGISSRSTDRLTRLSKKELGKRFSGSFVKGAVVGGGVTAGLQLTKTTLSAGAGAVVTGVGAGLSLGMGYATAGYQVATGKLNRDEFATEGGARAVEGGVSFLGGFSGAVVGSVAVTTGIRLIETGVARGITAHHKTLASRAIEKNGFKMSGKGKGQVTETQIKSLKMGADAKAELISSKQSGHTVRKTIWKPDTKGLNKAEISALKKFGIKVEHYQVIDTNGKVLSTFEVSRVIGRAPITRLHSGADSVVSHGKGTIKDGKVDLLRTSVHTKGMNFRDRLTLNKQFQDRTQQIGIEKVTGKGSVRYGKGYRLETSTGKSTSFLRFKADRTELFSKVTSSKTNILSKQQAEVSFFSSNGKGSILRGKATSYKDILGSGSSVTKSPLFTYGNTGGSNAFRSLTTQPSNSLLGSTTSPKGGQSLLSNPSTITTTTNAPPVLSGFTSQSASNIISATPVSSRMSILPSLSLTTPKSSQQFNNNVPSMNLGSSNLDILSTKKKGGFFTGSAIGGGISGTSSGSGSRGDVAQTPILKPIMSPATKPISKTAPATPTPLTAVNSFGFSNITPPPIGGFGLPFLGRVKVGGGGFGIKEKGGLKMKTAYNPSLGSILINYRKPAGKSSPQSLSKKTFSGLGLRPQLDFSGKKSKKKKKKKKK